ncbi:MAG: multiheme c-type cytochrome [Terriglobales bacterium]
MWTTVVWGMLSVAALTAAAQQSPPPPAPAVFQYTGPGSCSASACHGGIQPRQETHVQQNEYSTWVVQDKHAKAFSALGSPLSLRIGRNLGLQQKPEAARQCLTCHALDVPTAARARTFDLTDGVSCESCHGPAASWLGPHTARDWTHQQSVRVGMYDTKDLARRQEKCLSCHLGTENNIVNHEMIAAGHPDLTFELDSYSAVMPRHWKEPLDKDAWLNVRAWSVGQGVQLTQSLSQLARRARGPNWPEYAEMDCFACHHALTRPEDSWRQETGYSGRRPGVAAWNPARYALLQVLVKEIDPDDGRQLDSDLQELASSMNRLSPDRARVTATAQSGAETAQRLVSRISAQPYDGPLTLRLLRSIVAQSGPLSDAGERTAEQATMALDSLFIAFARNQRVANEQAIRQAISGLFQQLENPSAYNPKRFAEQMRKVGQLLP